MVNSLEAALWAFARASSFKEAILLAVNLGDDADTTGAICGQLAGAFYGAEGTPKRWRDLLARREQLTEYAQALLQRAMAWSGPVSVESSLAAGASDKRRRSVR